MRLNTKTLLFFAIIMSLLVTVVTALSAWSFRRFSLYMAERHTSSVAEAVKIGLTEAMINGTIDKRQEFLERLRNTPGVTSLHVVRGPAVIAQFGQGLPMEQIKSPDEAEVVATAKAAFSVFERDGDLLYRALVPYVATDIGTPNCRQCHNVDAGAALGAVTIEISLAEVRNQAVLAVFYVMVAVMIAAALSLLWLRRLIHPVSATAVAVREVTARAANGDFHRRIGHVSDDEVGEIALHVNQLMTFLEREVGTIQERVAELMGQQRNCGGNQLAATTEMVEALVEAAKFKQAIEEDRTKGEIYQRLGTVLRDRFNFTRFSVYEVSASKNRMVPVIVDCQMDSPCHYCDSQILTDADGCRAKRTGHMIDSTTMPGICTMFRSTDEGDAHICLPIVLSGTTGCILQVVVGREEASLTRLLIPFLAVYLRETAPVLEAKRLMDSLRESALRDGLTGLYNRRFLEEYVETLIATVERRRSGFAVLMLDFDYFKQVNDTHGHEAGDKALKALAEIVVRNVRSSDLIVRYGGEEFLIILIDSEADPAVQVAEKIRGEVANTKIALPNAVLQKTISIGVAHFPSDADTFWQVVKFADVALYEAKHSGRNRVVRFVPAMWQEVEKY